MKIAIVRGDFANPWELQNFADIAKSNDVHLFTGHFPIASLNKLNFLKIHKRLTPADLNFGKISMIKMSILNRLFHDSHLIYGICSEFPKFDIVHCAETYFGYTAQAVNAKKMGGKFKLFSTVWENIPFNNEGFGYRKRQKREAIKYVDCFLATTRTAKQVLLQEGCNPKKVKVLYPGVDTNIFRPKTKEDIDEANIHLLTVGRLVPEKGIKQIIEMFLCLQKVVKNITLTIVGEGPMEKEIQLFLKQNNLKNIILIKHVPYDRMPSLYRSSDIYVHFPIGSDTWKEQYGMSLVEAMACGLPIVALNKGSISEILGSAGKVAEEKEFFSVLKSFVKDKNIRKKYSILSRKRAVKLFSTKSYSKNLLKIYRSYL